MLLKFSSFLMLFFGVIICNCQETKNDLRQVMSSKQILPLKFSYSNKQMRNQSSTENYIKSYLSFKQNDIWDSIPIEMKARGNFRRTNCYFPPIKLKIKASKAEGTLFEGYKKMKVVMPCLLQNRSNDDVLKEYLAYQLYELISPAHFKTRLIALEFTDDPNKKMADDPLAAIFMEVTQRKFYAANDIIFTRRKPKTHHFNAILIEDVKNVAQRNDAKVLDRFVHPLAQDSQASLRNAFFQFMIGNTDFSTAYGHNQKLLFLHHKALPVPYDFDMSGLVNASYAVVSNINDQNLPINEVTQRHYRGFQRDTKTTAAVRSEFLALKGEMLQAVEEYKLVFENQKTFQQTKDFILDFFKILESDVRYRKEIIEQARIK